MHAVLARHNFFLMLFVFIAANAVLTMHANAAPVTMEPVAGIDAILVIDTSGSMRNADPERITLEATMLFMDMMDTSNSRLGIVGFSGVIHTVIPLMSIEEPEDREYIRSRVSDFVYHGWTDIGLAMRTAAEMLLDDPVEANSPMILLFTDGKIELPAHWEERFVEDSYYDAQWAVDNVGNFAPIYTIGLNYDGTVNTEFLADIARQTNATSYIIEEAALLPRLFNQIFASHIRSSVIEITEFVATGTAYTGVIIPISSIFAAEANVVLHSNHPIDGIRLHNPMGREIVFDNEVYTLSTANIYSMIKILEPMPGDWLLSVRGISDDHITVNLIYNYNIGVAAHINQYGSNGVYFNPAEPLTVQAHIVSAQPQPQIQILLREATATVNVFDMDLNLVEELPMRNTGTGFAVDFIPSALQNLRLSVVIEHPHLRYRTATAGVVFHPRILTELAATLEPASHPTEEIVAEPEHVSERLIPGTIIFIILGVVAFAIIMFLFIYRIQGKRKFTGYFEIRALLPNGKYTALEIPNLRKFAGKVSLEHFMDASLGTKAARIFETNIPLKGTHIAPITIADSQMIQLTTDGTVYITDKERNAVTQRKFIWEKDLQLIFSLIGGTSRIEMTYRIDG